MQLNMEELAELMRDEGVKVLARKAIAKEHAEALEALKLEALRLVATPDNLVVGARVVRNPTWREEWGDEGIHPPTEGFGIVRGFTDADRHVFGEIGSGGQWASLAAVAWDGEDWAREYRVGFGGEFWLSNQPAPACQ